MPSLKGKECVGTGVAAALLFGFWVAGAIARVLFPAVFGERSWPYIFVLLVMGRDIF